MTVNLNHLNLDNLTIASPCTADWNAMAGDDRVRHCPQCRLNVYNLSELSRPQAEQLLKEKEGKLCVRYFQRHDGTILTQNCPAALRRAQQALQRMVAAIAGLFGIVLTSTTACVPLGQVSYGMPSARPTTHPDRKRQHKLSTTTPKPRQPTTQPDGNSEILTAEPVPTPAHQP